MKIQTLLFLLFYLMLSCKTNSPDFSRKELNKNELHFAFGAEQLKLKRITQVVVAANGVGLYTFTYKRHDAEILVPVLKFEQDYFFFDERNIANNQAICDRFKSAYPSLFTTVQMIEIMRRYKMGVVFSGKN